MLGGGQAGHFQIKGGHFSFPAITNILQGGDGDSVLTVADGHDLRQQFGLGERNPGGLGKHDTLVDDLGRETGHAWFAEKSAVIHMRYGNTYKNPCQRCGKYAGC